MIRSSTVATVFCSLFFMVSTSSYSSESESDTSKFDIIDILRPFDTVNLDVNRKRSAPFVKLLFSASYNLKYALASKLKFALAQKLVDYLDVSRLTNLYSGLSPDLSYELTQRLDKILSGDLRYEIHKDGGSRLIPLSGQVLPVYSNILKDIKRTELTIYDDETESYNSKSRLKESNLSSFDQMSEVNARLKWIIRKKVDFSVSSYVLQMIQEVLASRAQTFSVEGLEFIFNNLLNSSIPRTLLAISSKRVKHYIIVKNDVVIALTRSWYQIRAVQGEVFPQAVLVQRKMLFNYNANGYNFDNENFEFSLTDTLE